MSSVRVCSGEYVLFGIVLKSSCRFEIDFFVVNWMLSVIFAYRASLHQFKLIKLLNPYPTQTQLQYL